MALRLAELATLVLNAGLPPAQRSWHTPGRLHAGCQAPPAGTADEAAFAAAVAELFAGRPGVNWARWNSGTRRVVIDGPAADTEAAALLARLNQLEAELEGVALAEGRDHPADLEPVLRSLVEIVAQLAGLGLGLGLQGRPDQRRLGIDLAAALRLLETLPPLRESLDRRIGAGSAELLLRLAGSLDAALLRGVAGPLVDLLEGGLRLRSRLLHRQLWSQCEAAWNSRPHDHPASLADPGPRPAPLPAGPIERYSEKASLLALAAFGWGVASLRRLEGPSAALLAGLPRPALLARQVFSLELGRRLEALGALLLDPAALERLDRLDTVVLDASLAAAPWHGDLEAVVRQCGLALEQPSADTALALVRTRQARGHGVLMLSLGASPALAAADLAVGLVQPGHTPPWQAHLIAPASPSVAWLLLPACAAARRCSERGVQASLFDVVVGLALALDGLSSLTSAGVNQAANLLSLVAMAQAVQLARTLKAATPPPPPALPWHSLEATEVLQLLGSSAEGLAPSPPGAARSQGRRSPGLGDLLLDELDTPLTPVLGTGAVLSGLVGAPVDGALILGVLGLNALIGARQRQGVERRLAQLLQRQAAAVWVRRQGELERGRDLDLRPGDVVVLEAGEVVPADCRLLQAHGLQVDEAVLSGEPFPVSKDSRPCPGVEQADRHCMLYQGSTVVAGQASAVVVAVGEACESRLALAAAQDATSPDGVEARLAGLTASTTPVAMLGGGLLLLQALLRGRDPRTALSEAVALTVAAVPEGLPLLANLAQAAAADRLAQQGVLVRNPRVLEALGRVSVLCLDKTGTLTSGRIQLRQVWAEGQLWGLEQLSAAGERVLRLALRATPRPEPGRPLAHPTDRALREGAARADLNDDGWQVLHTLAFEPERGYHACSGQTAGEPQRASLCVKGAPDVVLAACPEAPATAQAAAERLAAGGLRVLAVAERPLAGNEMGNEAGSEGPGPAGLSDRQVRGLRFAGFVVLADPIRPTARAAVHDLRRAGIAVKLITGDHPATALAIATDLGLTAPLEAQATEAQAGEAKTNEAREPAKEQPQDAEEAGALPAATVRVLTGADLESLSDPELAAALAGTVVCARVTPLQKLRLVKQLQAAGETVAMGGDGANDAAAIRLAQVGIALGERATDAARLAADLVVTDGSVEALGQAVLEGRSLWRAVRDAAGLLVGGNLGEIGFTVLSALLAGGTSLNTRQLLLANLLTDVAPALTIAARPPRPGAAAELIREGPEASLGSQLEREILRRGAATAVAAWLAQGLARSRGSQAADTVGLATLIGTQLAQMASSGAGDRSTVLAALGSYGALLALVQTPGLAALAGCTPLTGADLLEAALMAGLGTALSAAHAPPTVPDHT